MVHLKIILNYPIDSWDLLMKYNVYRSVKFPRTQNWILWYNILAMRQTNDLSRLTVIIIHHHICSNNCKLSYKLLGPGNEIGYT